MEDINKELEDKSPQDVLGYAFKKFSNIAISFSGAEDVALVDMAIRINPSVSIFILDTGRLHAETHRFIEQVRKHYCVNIEVLFPDTNQLQKLVSEKGFFSFYEDGHKECCSVRKVKPLKKKLSTLDAWVTGQRRDQNPNTRMHIPLVQKDSQFSFGDNDLIKFNPLATWSSSRVWEYIRSENVPYNPLHDKGFISLGCEPCTKPVGPNQHEREGRWWWEQSEKKECGLHLENVNE